VVLLNGEAEYSDAVAEMRQLFAALNTTTTAAVL